MAEDSVVVTLVNQVSEDLSVSHTVAGGDGLALEDEVLDQGGESTSEGDVEVEHVLADDNSSVHASEDGGSGSMSNITFDVRKRTLIMLWQRTILEDFYKAGMTSASMQLHSMHLAAAEKTGLDSTVIKNWIRNRRRPAAMKSAERLQERINQGDVSLPPHSAFSHVHTQASLVTAAEVSQQLPRPAATTAALYYPVNSTSLISPQALVAQVSHSSPFICKHMPEAKRNCLDQISASSHVSSSFTHTSQPISSPTAHQPPHTQTSTPPTPHLSSTSSLLVKVRVFDSGEADFYEVEVPGPTYEGLLQSCAEELEVDISQIVKIRKLPNVLIRRDRDVLRLHEGQELEVVLKESTAGGNIAINHLAAPITGPTIYSAAPSNSILNIHLPDPSSLAAVPTNNLGLHPTTHMNGMP